MPELPEITAYLEGMERTVLGEPLRKARVRSPSLLQSWDPRLSEAEGRSVRGLRRIGKRIVWEMGTESGDPAGGPLFLVFHLMVTGRFRWREPGVEIPRKSGLAAFDFPSGSLLLTEAGTKKRASLWVVRGEAALARHDPGGLEVLDADRAAFREALLRENRTLKRALTDPRILSGIGNAHSDEILLYAGLSPLQRTRNLTDEEVGRLWRVARESLTEWTERLRTEFGDAFPEKITAFHPAMAAHGKFEEPCPVCGTPIQRIRYAERETNYCPDCQTGGKLLADRGVSRLLGDDWPSTLEELERMREERRD